MVCFTDCPKCPKCGVVRIAGNPNKFVYEYRSSYDKSFDEVTDCIYVTCYQCGHVWSMKCADASE